MRVWARVKDKVSGHQYDVTLERMQVLVERGAVEEVPGRRHHGQPRSPKLQRPLATLVPPTKRAAKPPAEAVEPKESESA